MPFACRAVIRFATNQRRREQPQDGPALWNLPTCRVPSIGKLAEAQLLGGSRLAHANGTDRPRAAPRSVGALPVRALPSGRVWRCDAVGNQRQPGRTPIALGSCWNPVHTRSGRSIPRGTAGAVERCHPRACGQRRSAEVERRGVRGWQLIAGAGDNHVGRTGKMGAGVWT